MHMPAWHHTLSFTEHADPRPSSAFMRHARDVSICSPTKYVLTRLPPVYVHVPSYTAMYHIHISPSPYFPARTITPSLVTAPFLDCHALFACARPIRPARSRVHTPVRAISNADSRVRLRTAPVRSEVASSMYPCQAATSTRPATPRDKHARLEPAHGDTVAQPIATLTAHRKELGYSEPWGSGTPGDVVDAGSPQLVMSALAYAVDWGSTARASADPTSGDSERLGAVLHGHFPCL